MEYLLELRTRLLYCIFLVVIVFCTLYYFANSLYQLVIYPLLKELPEAHLIATKITAPFLVPVKFVFICSLFILIPFFFYQLWAFISPALYIHERKKVWVLLMPSIILFYSGVIFAYFVILPTVFRFFVKTTPSHVQLLPDMGQYLDFVLQMLVAFGIAFEVPILVLVLVLYDLVTLTKLKAARRYVIVLAFILGMILSPPDVLSQTLLALPIWLLYELGMILAGLLYGTMSVSSTQSKLQ